MDSIRHKLLTKQLRRFGLEDAGTAAAHPAWIELLEHVSRSYFEADQDRYTLERSLEISSTEMQGLHARLEEERRRLEAVLVALADGICHLDIDGHILFANPRAVALLQLDESETSTDLPSRVQLFADIERGVELDIVEAIRAGRLRRIPKGFVEPTGAPGFPASIAFNPIQARGELVGTVLSVRDIADDIDSDRRMQQAIVARQAADTANRAKSEFLANMSHELRTPLHGILSYARLGADRYLGPPEKSRMYFDRIHSSGSVLLDLVNRLLDLARLESGRMTFDFQSHDLQEMIEGVACELQGLASESEVNIQIAQPSRPLRVVVDQTTIAQVLRNLLGNALKWSGRNTMIQVGAVERDDRIQVSVRDNGIGVPENELEAIFDKFVQSAKTKNGSGGTGLGLAISREIVEAHQGRIWAVNNPDGGTTFIVEIPRAPSDPMQVEILADVRSV